MKLQLLRVYELTTLASREELITIRTPYKYFEKSKLEVEIAIDSCTVRRKPAIRNGTLMTSSIRDVATHLIFKPTKCIT